LLNCKDFLSELGDYLDDSTPPELRAQIEKHMHECPNCWVICDTTKKTVKIYKGCEPQAVPDAVSDRLMQALQRKMAERKTGC
jgi:anti-sigma factor RsiW